METKEKKTENTGDIFEKIIYTYGRGYFCTKCNIDYPTNAHIICDNCGTKLVWGGNIAREMFEQEIEMARQEGYEEGFEDGVQDQRLIDYKK